MNLLKEVIEDTNSRLAVNIRHLRKQLDCSQEELAQKLGLNRGNIASYEKGSAEPKICNLLNLSHVFQVAILDLANNDLRCPNALKSARSNYQYELKEEDKHILEKFYEEAEEIKTVLHSLKVCQDFKLKQLNNNNLSTEIQSINSNHEQLCSVGVLLMKAHSELLSFVKSRMK